jgi:hypothetical protein
MTSNQEGSREKEKKNLTLNDFTSVYFARSH